MQRMRALGRAIKNFMIIFSFIMNFVVAIILIVVVQQIFMIKNGILEPLIDGLHRNFVAMDEAHIKTTIIVDDEIPINFTLPIDQQTTVVLQQPVPLSANATFALPGGGGTINGTVNLNLPVGLSLPVQLDMDVPVTATIPITLPVEVDIPLEETELHEPFANLRDLFDPFVRLLDNLPGNWGASTDFAIDAAQGEVNLLDSTVCSRNPTLTICGGSREIDPDAAADTAGEGDPDLIVVPEGEPDTTIPVTPVIQPTRDPSIPPVPTVTTVPLQTDGQ